jgi:hypothetical protein
MRKLITIILGLLLVFSLLSGCSAKKSSGSDTGEPEGVKSSKHVFKADALLSAEEATAIVGGQVTINRDTLYINPETGVSNTYYDYKYSDSTDLSALFLLTQDDAITEDKSQSGTSKDDYELALKLVGDDAEPIKELGDKAFIDKAQIQIHVLYGNRYFLVAFGTTDDPENAKEVSLKIARKIIENINKKR